MIILPELRKFVTFDEDIHREGEKTADSGLKDNRRCCSCKKPLAGQGYIEDLQPEIQRMAPPLGKCSPSV